MTGTYAHNYERAHSYNLWFTIIALGRPRLEEILQSVRQQAVVKLLSGVQT